MSKVIRYAGANLYPKQRAAIYDPARISIVEAGTKCGKTVGCLSWLFEEAGPNGREGRNYWWGAPVYGQAEIGFRRMQASLPRHLYKANQTRLTISLVNGTTLWFKSTERPDDLYGEDVYAVVLDEASRMREEAWHAVRSTLTKTGGKVRIIGNVKGRKNWFYRLARLAESGAPGMAYHRITCWDAVEAGVLDREEIEAAFRDFQRLGREGAFRQLYLAEAADDGDNPFGLAAIEACLTDALSLERPIAGGVDLAGRGAVNLNPAGDSLDRDYTAIVLLDKEGKATHIDRFRKPHTETETEIVKVVGKVPALIDSTGTGDAVVERLQRRGDMRVEGYTFTERSRQDLLEGLALAIGEQGIGFPDGPLRIELDSFEFVYSGRGVRWAVPAGMHDDLAFAVALAVRKLPWRRKHVAMPVGIASPEGSRWLDGAGAMRGIGGEPPPERDRMAGLPILTRGPSSGRWTGADR